MENDFQLNNLVDTLEQCLSILKCSICLNLMHQPNAAVPCGHLFCEHCLRKALKYSNACPICKQSLNTRRGSRNESELHSLIAGFKRIRSNLLYTKIASLSNVEISQYSQDINLSISSTSTEISSLQIAKKSSNKASKHHQEPSSKSNELIILQEHTLVWPQDFKANHSIPTICLVCFRNPQFQHSKLYTCSGRDCYTTVHKECYGNAKDNQDWLCDTCLDKRNRASKAACCICKSDIPYALKPTNTGHFAHLFCAIWVPELFVSDTKDMQPIAGIEDINAQRFNLSCFLCKKRNHGPCIQCAYKRCSISVHPWCALENNYLICTSNEPGIRLQDFKFYCTKHKRI